MKLRVNISKDPVSKIDMRFQNFVQHEVGSEIPFYKGEYDVTPEVEVAQTLETRGKRMSDNVRVGKIPVHEMSNSAGGETLIIGKELIDD